MPKAFKLPKPADYGSGQPAVLCPGERVLALYNGLSEDNAKRIAKKVRAWFFAQAKLAGWAGVHFLKEVQTSHGGGFILWRPADRLDVQVTVTKTVLVLHDESDKEVAKD